MNILVEELPESLEVDGKSYRINSDFRACLLIMMAFEDNELTMQEKQYILLNNLFAKEMPSNLEGAIQAALQFLNGKSGSDGETEERTSPRLYSLSHDANFIYAAFKQTHGIDLQTDKLHWWKFLALFMDLGSETTFCSLVSLRKRIKTGKATKEEKAAAREMGEMFIVPELDTRTLEEKELERKFLEAIGSAA
jgi:hypothetical protein